MHVVSSCNEDSWVMTLSASICTLHSLTDRIEVFKFSKIPFYTSPLHMTDHPRFKVQRSVKLEGRLVSGSQQRLSIQNANLKVRRLTNHNDSAPLLSRTGQQEGGGGCFDWGLFGRHFQPACSKEISFKSTLAGSLVTLILLMAKTIFIG